MFATLKNISIRKALPRCILYFIAAVLCLLLGGDSIVKVLSGPVDIGSVPVEDINGQYVKATISVVVDEYAYTERLENEQDEAGVVTSREYMVATPSGEQYYGLLLGSDDFDPLQAQLDSLIYDYEPVVESITVAGTMFPMDDVTTELFDVLLEYYSISNKMAIHSYLAVGLAGAHSIAYGWALFCLFVFFLSLGLFRLIWALAGFYQNPIRRFIKENPSSSQLEEWFPGEEETGPFCFGPVYILFQKGPSSRVILADDLVWVFDERVRIAGFPFRHEVYLGTKDGKLQSVPVPKELSGEIIQYSKDRYPQATIGYTHEAQKAFRKIKK